MDPMKTFCVRVAVVCLVAAAALADAPRERMFRLTTSFNTVEVPQAGTQNFAVAQDERGVTYVGNLGGVLEYDGVRWRLIALPHRATPFALVPIGERRIAIGSDGEFGYIGPDAKGTMRFVSLASLMPPEARSGSQIDRIARANDGVVFLYGGAVLHWNYHDIAVVARYSRDDPPWSVSIVDGQAWIGTPQGLQVIANRKMHLVPGGELFAGKRITFVRRIGESLIVAIRREGLVRFDGKSIVPFSPVASARGARAAFVDCITLPDGRRAIVTRRGGIIVIRDDGSVDEVIDAESGLPDTDISGASLTNDGALWLANENGVTRVDVSSPVSLLDSRAKLRGSVVAIVRHRGSIYAGTTSGVYRVNTLSDATTQQPIVEQIGHNLVAGWSLCDMNDELLIGTSDALLVMRDRGDPITVAGTQGQTVYALTRSARDPNLVWVGTDRGLGIARRSTSGWSFNGPIANVPSLIRSVIEDPDG